MACSRRTIILHIKGNQSKFTIVIGPYTIVYEMAPLCFKYIYQGCNTFKTAKMFYTHSFVLYYIHRCHIRRFKRYGCGIRSICHICDVRTLIYFSNCAISDRFQSIHSSCTLRFDTFTLQYCHNVGYDEINELKKDRIQFDGISGTYRWTINTRHTNILTKYTLGRLYVCN